MDCPFLPTRTAIGWIRFAQAPGTTQRWRVINATSARHFRIALEGHTLTLVGTDGGLLGSPISSLPEILVAPRSGSRS